MKIIVTDDDVMIRQSLTVFLTDAGHEVLEAADGQQALALTEAQSPDLVLLDLRMPRMGGLTALRRLAHERPELPVIVISGVGQVTEAVEAMRSGAWDFLTKPIDDLSLLSIAMDKVVEKQTLRRQVREYQRGLEELVRQRTAELQDANLALEQKATALKVVLDTIQEEKREGQRIMAHRIETILLPSLRGIKDEAPASTRAKLDEFERNLMEVTAPYMDQLAQRFASLTPSETRICQLLRRGQTSKEIAKIENISPDTVDTHRRNIRRKLNITSEQVNLVSFLQSLDSPEI